MNVSMNGSFPKRKEKPMANTQTTPTSVASQLTDEEIEHLIDVCDKDADRHEREANVARRYDRCDSMRELNEYAKDERLTAAVLRDYVRLRKLENALFERIKEYRDEHQDEVIVFRDIKILLADAEKEKVK